MLISIKILYQEIKHVSSLDKSRMLFFLVINVKLPTGADNLTFFELENILCSAELSMKVFYITSGPCDAW